MEIALAVEELLGEAQYRSAKNYQRLVATWEDERPVPTMEELEAAWVIVQQKIAEHEAILQQSEIDRANARADKIQGILADVATRQTQITADRALLPNATAQQRVEILDRMLITQRQELEIIERLIKAVQHIA